MLNMTGEYVLTFENGDFSIFEVAEWKEVGDICRIFEVGLNMLRQASDYEYSKFSSEFRDLAYSLRASGRVWKGSIFDVTYMCMEGAHIYEYIFEELSMNTEDVLTMNRLKKWFEDNREDLIRRGAALQALIDA